MEEKFIMMDVLNTEKNLAVNTVTALNEASCDKVYQVYLDIFDDLTKEAKEVFNICYNQNWYQLESAQSDKIKQEINKLIGELNKEG